MGTQEPGTHRSKRRGDGDSAQGQEGPPGRDHQGSGTLHRTQLSPVRLHLPRVLGLAADLREALERGRGKDPLLLAQGTSFLLSALHWICYPWQILHQLAHGSDLRSVPKGTPTSPSALRGPPLAGTLPGPAWGPQLTQSYLGGPQLPTAPVHVDAVLAQEGEFPWAVHESRAEQASLPQVKGLLDPCREHTGALPGSSLRYPQVPTRENPHLPHGTSPSRADCPQPGPSSSGKSGQHGAGPVAPGKTRRTGPATGGTRVTEASLGGSGQARLGPRTPSFPHLLGQQRDEVPLELGLDNLHHVLDLCWLAAVNELIQGQQLLRAAPALQGDPSDPGSVSPASPATALATRALAPGPEPEAGGSLVGHTYQG